MIRSAVLKLTLWYLLIIMVISVAFSLVLYQISTQQINDSLRHQELNYFNDFNQFGPAASDIDQVRIDQMSESRNRLRGNLLLFNLATLLAGGAASYMLARRTLRPIAEAMESQSRFTSDASHELRTPLTVMQTEIEVALRRGRLTEKEAKELLSSNLEEIANLKKLSEGLLHLARTNGKEVQQSTASLENVVAGAVKRTAALAAEKGITVKNETTQISLKGDEQNLTELAVILIENAVKYSDPKTTITLTSKISGRSACLSVADHGYGIKASDVPHIFERFYRADTSRSRDKVEGYGLGLSIAKKIVDVHGGSIDVKSIPGKGSTFTVKLLSA
jgi:two-component system, OmpR family, sensor histidine kinase CiaH